MAARCAPAGKGSLNESSKAPRDLSDKEAEIARLVGSWGNPGRCGRQRGVGRSRNPRRPPYAWGCGRGCL